MRKEKVFEGLDERELQYVNARSEAKSNAEALRTTGFSQAWLSKRNIDDLNRRATILRTDAAVRAQKMFSDSIEEATRVKIAGLKSRDERIKQAVATEIIERWLGKPTQKTELSTPNPITLRVVYEDESADGSA